MRPSTSTPSPVLRLKRGGHPWPFRRRWTIAIVGAASGKQTTITFLKFWTHRKATRFAAEGNLRLHDAMSRYEVRRR